MSLVFLLSGASHAQDPLGGLKDETLSYFKPLKGRIVSANGKEVVSDLGLKAGIRKGMRVTIFREGMPFLHPVTKEPMGRVETPVGKAVVGDVREDGSTMETINGEIKTGDVARISEMKVRVLFFQDRSVEWSLGESYYQLLKESGRFEIIDTSLDSGDDAKVIAEAKRLTAEAAIILTAEGSEKEVLLKQRVLWTDDSSKLGESEAKIDVALVKELRSAASLSTPLSSLGDVLLFYDLPFSARLIAAGDINGDRSQELIISNGRDLFVYAAGASLQNLYEIKGSGSGDHLWLDTMDINGDGRDEIIVTSMRDGEVVSSIYELKGLEFSVLWKDKLFLRTMPPFGLIAQKYDDAEGFAGPVFSILYHSGDFRAGDAIRLPKDVNIYDFTYVFGPGNARYVLAYDNPGFLNLFNEEGLRVWRSKEDFGGSLTAFKKFAPTVMVDRGEWSIKDRIHLRDKESFVVKRIPLANMARGLGYKSSDVKTLWWTGLSMEESTLINGIPGGVIDFALSADKLVILAKPLFGIKPKKLLKGENPMGSTLSIYSLKGR